MTANTVAQKSEVIAAHPSRLQLIYAAHQQLEDELDTVRAYASAARKHSGTADVAKNDVDGFSPWTGVQDAAERCINKATCCLRLFSPMRTVAHLKGLTTLTALYGAAGTVTPQARVVAFLECVSERLDGVLPMEVVLSGGRCLQRLDAATADNYLFGCITKVLTAPTVAAAEDETSHLQRYRVCLGMDPDSPAYHVHLRALLLLQIEVAAEAEHAAHTLTTAFDAKKLEEAISISTYEELAKYERVCWREVARVRAAQAAPVSSPVVTTGENKSAGAYAASSSSTKATTSLTTTVQATQSAAAAAAVSRFGGLSNWKWHAVRIAVLVLLAVLVRFTSGPLARALKGVLQVTHTTRSRQRTLTL
ncbi:hypothetical protein N2W54_001066 [Lotmaria passim]